MFIVPCRAFPLYATACAASVCKLWHRLYYSQDEDKGAPSHQHTHPPIDNKEKKKLISIQILLMGITSLLSLSEHQFSPLSAMHFCFGHPLVMTVNKNYSVNHMTPYMLCRKKKHGKNPIASVVCNSAGGTVNNHTALSSDLQVAKYIKKKRENEKEWQSYDKSL